jgi:hypothetical protein
VWSSCAAQPLSSWAAPPRARTSPPPTSASPSGPRTSTRTQCRYRRPRAPRPCPWPYALEPRVADIRGVRASMCDARELMMGARRARTATKLSSLDTRGVADEGAPSSTGAIFAPSLLRPRRGDRPKVPPHPHPHRHPHPRPHPRPHPHPLPLPLLLPLTVDPFPALIRSCHGCPHLLTHRQMPLLSPWLSTLSCSNCSFCSTLDPRVASRYHRRRPVRRRRRRRPTRRPRRCCR